MKQYSLLDHRAEGARLDLLHEHDIGVICRGAVAQGLLIGKAADSYLQYTDGEVARAAKAVAKVAGGLDLTPLTAALAYVWGHPAVATVALGIRTTAQLDEAIETLRHAFPLPDHHRMFLRPSVRSFRYAEHR